MEIVVILVLVLINGIFSMSEIALVSSKRFRLEYSAKKGNNGAKLALKLSSRPTRFLSTVQVGITLISILLGVFSSDDMQQQLALSLSGSPIFAPYANTLSTIIIVSAVTFITIIFGELVPKRIALLFPEKIASLMAMPMNALSVIAAPFIWLLEISTKLFLLLFGLKGEASSRITEEEIKAMLKQSVRGGDVQEIEQYIVNRVFALGDRRISELMTHRSSVVWLDINADAATIHKKISEKVHSVYPVGDGDMDKLLGVVTIKDIFPFGFGRTDEPFSIKSYLKKPLILHENTPAYKVLEAFRKAKMHFAVVADEYGGITGVVSMDDLLDALVGDVSENVQEEYHITAMEDGKWLADGQYPYFELLHYFDMHEEEQQHEFNTIAGLILDKLERIPAEGEKIIWKGYELRILDMDGLRIDKVQISKLPVE